MEKKGQQVGGSSSSSFTVDLFGPKDPSKSSTSSGVFGSVFGPASTGLVKDTAYPGRNQDYGSHHHQYGNVKRGNPEYQNQKDSKSIYQNEPAEPCYFSSSIYYGGQDIYSPPGQTTNPQQNFRKDGNDDDPNGNNSNSASRGNWWQGSLYY